MSEKPAANNHHEASGLLCSQLRNLLMQLSLRYTRFTLQFIRFAGYAAGYCTEKIEFFR